MADPFESPDLPDHWPHLDAFEDTDLRRVVTQVCTTDGELSGWIHVLAAEDEMPMISSAGRAAQLGYYPARAC